MTTRRTLLSLGTSMIAAASVLPTGEATAQMAKAPPLAGNLAPYLHEGPFIRAFVPRANAEQFIRDYLAQLGGKLLYDFEFEKIGARIIAIRSLLGNASILFTDNYAQLPDYTKNTKAMYVGDIRGAVAEAKAAGLTVLQEYTPTPGGAQGRIQMAPGYNIEIIEIASHLMAPASAS